MTEKKLSLVRRLVAFSLIVLGFILFPFLVSSAASQGNMLAGFSYVLLIVGCIGLGSFMFLRVGFWNAAKSLLIVLALSIPWFAIFLIPLPGEAQPLVAVFVALFAVLLYRHYRERNRLSKSPEAS